MNIMIVSAICGILFLTLVIVQIVMQSRHPVRSALYSLIPGTAALIAVNMLSAYTAVSIPVSPLTLIVSSVLGIPGVTCLLVLQRVLM